MTIVKSLVNEKLMQAEAVLRGGTPDDVVAQAESYLGLLDEYLDRLRKLKGIPQPTDALQSRLAGELVEQIRSAVRTAIEHATAERNRIDSLLSSLKDVSGWSAVETFNASAYKGACDWELVGTHVRTIAGGADLIITDAVVEAKRLRRETYCESFRLAA